jgi:hypothetical protein
MNETCSMNDLGDINDVIEFISFNWNIYHEQLHVQEFDQHNKDSLFRQLKKLISDLVAEYDI